MGYYSTLTVDTTEGTVVEPFVVTEYQSLADGLKPDHWYGWEGVTVDERGNIEEPSSDWHQKWYNDDVFARLLAERMKAGRITLHFTGEDDSRWGYVIEPDAVVEFSDSEYCPLFHYGFRGADLFRRLLDEAREHHLAKAEEFRRQKQAFDKNQSVA